MGRHQRWRYQHSRSADKKHQDSFTCIRKSGFIPCTIHPKPLYRHLWKHMGRKHARRSHTDQQQRDEDLFGKLLRHQGRHEQHHCALPAPGSYVKIYMDRHRRRRHQQIRSRNKRIHPLPFHCKFQGCVHHRFLRRRTGAVHLLGRHLHLQQEERPDTTSEYRGRGTVI